jgi:polysaccharide export outer membrane protein
MISFPLAGEVKAGGRTIEALRKELTEELKEFIKYPQVSVTVKSLGGKRVIVLGEVMSPGIYALTGEQTTLEAIGMAKGFTEHAVPSSVMLIQGGVENPQAKRLNLTKALDKADISDNVLMGEGDMVYVPRKFIRNANYFATQVLEPLYRAAFIAREVDDF